MRQPLCSHFSRCWRPLTLVRLLILVPTDSFASEARSSRVSTKREKVTAYRDMEVARIKSSEMVLREYFYRAFEERREIHNRLFDSLDAALESATSRRCKLSSGALLKLPKTRLSRT